MAGKTELLMVEPMVEQRAVVLVAQMARTTAEQKATTKAVQMEQSMAVQTAAVKVVKSDSPTAAPKEDSWAARMESRSAALWAVVLAP